MKVVISACVIVAVSEVGKRSSLFGALIAALPLTSLLAILWMHFEKTEIKAIASLSTSIFYLVIPSLFFFLFFPFLLQRGSGFWVSFSASAGGTILLYLFLLLVLKQFSITL